MTAVLALPPVGEEHEEGSVTALRPPGGGPGRVIEVGGEEGRMPDDGSTPAGTDLHMPPPTTRAGGRRVPPRGRARVEHLAGRVRRVARERWDVLAVIAAGGAVGSLARWGLTLLLPHPAGTFPWPTFTANVAGCLLLGVLMVLVLEVWPPSRYLRPFLGVGVLGGFTTFSTAMLDARALLVDGRTALAGLYVFGSVAAGLFAVVVGIGATRLAVRGRARRTGRRHVTRDGTTTRSRR